MKKQLTLIGTVIKVEYSSKKKLKKIYICNNRYKVQLLKMDKAIEKKLSSMHYNENITQIKTYKPFYYNKMQDLIIMFSIPKDLSNVFGLSQLNLEKLYGSTVKIESQSSIYNFTDKKDNNKKIRGWKLNMLSILKIEKKK